METTVKISQLDPNRSFTSITSYEYDNPVHLQPTRIINSLEGEDFEYSKLKYPQDYDLSAVPSASLMADKHMLLPIDKQSWRKINDEFKIVGGVTTEYGMNGDFVNPVKTYSFESQLPLTSINEGESANGYTDLVPEHYNLKSEYDYNSSGKPIAIKQGDFKAIKKNLAYIWNADDTKLEAVIDNAYPKEVVYLSFESEGNSTPEFKTGKASKYISSSFDLPVTPQIAGDYILSYWSKQGSNEWNYNQILLESYDPENDQIIIAESNSYIDEVRVHPVDATMKTFSYHNNNVITITDENGVSTFYSYDEFQRLNAVEDTDNNLLKSIQYHYKNQN